MTQWLLGTLLATSGLIVLILLVRDPVRRHFGARVAYGLWLIPAARLLMPTLTETVERPVAAPAPLIPAAGAPELSHLANFIGWPIVLLNLWLIGAFTLFIARVLQFRRQRASILATATEVGRAGSIRILQSPAVRGPVAFGIVDRVIAMPADFGTRYSEHERNLALQHELAHHRSGDLVANFLAFALLCLQWFNPLAWAAHAAFRFDQEAACDARVLDKASRSNRVDYGRAIAKAASGKTLLLASALDQRSTLHKRLECMLSDATGGRRLTGRLMVLTAMAAALPLTATRAISYVDSPAAYEFSPTPPAQPMPTVPLKQAHMTIGQPVQMRSERDGVAGSGDRAFAQARIGVDQNRSESRETVRARRDRQRGQSDAEQALTDQAQGRRDAEQAREQARRDADQAKRDAEEGRRGADWERERAARDAERGLRDQERGRREADRAKRDLERANRNDPEARANQ